MTTSKIVIGVLTVSYLVTGCANMDDPTRTKTEGTVGGAALGGGLGAVLGGKKGAGIGAILGGVAGYWAGSAIAERKQNYASQEEAIATEIAVNERDTKALQATNQQLQADIQQFKQQIATLQGRQVEGEATILSLQDQTADAQGKLRKTEGQVQNLQGRLSNAQGQKKVAQGELAAARTQKDAMTKKLGEAKTLLAKTQQNLQVSHQNYQTYKKAAKPEDLKKWQDNIAKLEQEKDALQSNVETLTAMSSSL